MGTSGEMAAVAAFVLVVGAVLLGAAVECLRLLRERRRGLPPPPGRAARLRRRGLLGAAAAGLLCMAWGRFVEPFWPEVTRASVPCPGLPAGARPVRLVHLSDLHCEPDPRLEDRLPALVAAEAPDLILFTGDSINEPAGLPVFRRTLEALARVAPVYAVKGNWDVWYFRDAERFAGTGAVELDGASRALDVRGLRLRLSGAAYGRDREALAALAEGDREEFRVALCHTPDLAPALVEGGADLVLAGHTHGGQVALPLLGPVITFTSVGRDLARGLHRLGRGWLYTNRGIGMEGGAAPRVRFLARPEITVLDLVRP